MPLCDALTKNNTRIGTFPISALRAFCTESFFTVVFLQCPRRRAEDSPTAKHHWCKPHTSHKHHHKPTDAGKPLEAASSQPRGSEPQNSENHKTTGQPAAVNAVQQICQSYRRPFLK